MPLWSDMNGFPEGGFPILANDGEQICMGTFYPTPLKANNLMLDVVGNSRLLGALVIGGGLSGVTTLAMGGALSGVTTLGASGLVTLSGASPLSITNQNAVILITGDNASLGTLLQRVSRGFFKNLEITNTPTVNGDPVALLADLQRYALLTNPTFLNNITVRDKLYLGTVTPPATDGGALNALVWDNSTGEVKQRAISGESSSAKLTSFYTDASTSGTGQTDLYSYTLPANTLNSDGDTIQFDCTIISGSITPSGNIYVTLGGYTKAISMHYGSVPHVHKIIFTRISSTKVRFSYYGLTSISTSYYEEPSTTYDFTSTIIIKVGASASAGTATAKMGLITKY